MKALQPEKNVAIKAISYSVRNLTATHPDDYPVQEFDILAHCDDSKTRHSDGTYDTLAEAEAEAACQECRRGVDDLDQWTVTPNVRIKRRRSRPLE